MSEENIEDKLEDVKEESLEPVEPLEVKIINHPEKPKSDFDESEANEYENMYPTDEQIKEYSDEVE